jgi:hypothetical protein
MRFWTGHTRSGSPPLLLREGFCLGALLFGPLWLIAHRAWIPGALALGAGVLVLALAAGPTAVALLLGLAIWLGLTGRDLRRWSMRQRGILLFEVVAAHDETDALTKLLERRPNLPVHFLRPGAI